MLFDDLRPKLSSGELNLKKVIENQKDGTEFQLSLKHRWPTDLGDSDNEDMKARWREVAAKHIAD